MEEFTEEIKVRVPPSLKRAFETVRKGTFKSESAAAREAFALYLELNGIDPTTGQPLPNRKLNINSLRDALLSERIAAAALQEGHKSIVSKPTEDGEQRERVRYPKAQRSPRKIKPKTPIA